eukprot:8841416-Pyramimonas_sp.AAC.1
MLNINHALNDVTHRLCELRAEGGVLERQTDVRDRRGSGAQLGRKYGSIGNGNCLMLGARRQE